MAFSPMINILTAHSVIQSGNAISRTQRDSLLHRPKPAAAPTEGAPVAVSGWSEADIPTLTDVVDDDDIRPEDFVEDIDPNDFGE